MLPTDADRMLLQRLMANGATEEHEVRKIARKLTGENLSHVEVEHMVNKIAELIQPYALDVRRGVYDDGRMYFGVVNTGSDPLTAFSSNYKPWEIVFFRRAIEEIVESDEGMVDESDLYNLRDGTTIGEVTELLRRLTAELWLAHGDDDSSQKTLGPRCFLELIAFLRDLELKKCAICSYELLRGVSCVSGQCATQVHSRCMEKFEGKGSRYKCSTCRKPLQKKTTPASRR
ncbi:TPA: hypothetical protein N0F65_011057 [Lagenidium giganteum]|uniref:Non-structural maintenance of chromosomes element 1 homolog n=1 Tax=Lagenidium giganteum TaxID=4803 RepID=A0AAV2ZF80_9STRA|nr:TPA: hypothetical protein N0F65_011057 [Lagenidium giganteum]